MATRNVTRLNGEYVARRFVSTGRRPDGIKVINKTGSNIAQDKIVAISGYDTTTGLLKVVLADPSAPAHADLWVTLNSIANNTADYVGKGGLSLANLDTSSFTSVGDPVYLSSTVGGFSASVPAVGAAIQVGFVRAKSSTVGQIVWDFLPTAVSVVASSTGILTATGTISTANIVGTSAGQLGHANGVVLVPASGATKINQLVYALVENDFLTAAFTGGGATGIKLGGGGVAVSNTVTAAVFIQAAADISVQLGPEPSLTVASVYTLNNSLNLVSAAAPTQPGTAAGVIRYTVGYRVITSLLD